MDRGTKHAEVEVYDGDTSTRPSYGSIWDDAHFERLLQSGPAAEFETMLHDVAADNRVLVLGCGTGSNVRTALDDEASRVVGIELSANRLRESNETIDDGRAAFARADAEELPFSRDAFDVVVSHSVLHHLPNWRTTALEEMRRVLANDGRLLLYEPGRYNLPAVARRKLFPSDIHTPDERPFDPGELERVLSDHFDRVRLNGHCLVSNVVPVLANYSPMALPTWLGPKLYEYERLLIDHGARRFGWILTGVAENPR